LAEDKKKIGRNDTGRFVRTDRSGLRGDPQPPRNTEKIGRQSSGRFVSGDTARRHAGISETWTFTKDGRIKTVTTTGTSASAMDEAVVIYKKALRRLADR
jgi:hypothetical protein